MKEFSFVLTTDKPYKEFKLENPDSVIDIVQVFVNKLMDQPREEWSRLLSELDLYFEFTSSKQGTITEPVDLIKYFSTHHAVPVIEICGMIVPEQHASKKSSVIVFPDLRIELKSHRGKLPENLAAEVKCMISEGAVEV
ncbi:MAG: hypothetical protein JW915_10380 [Chitinispirillaceae bacterium]|nr:hypothetical protein [Chitinispirillaceae bacterium]